MMRRRGFLARAVVAASTLVAAAIPFGVSRMLAPFARSEPRTHLRPPGALADDAAFVAACIGCGLCGEVCPVRCIRFHARDGAGEVDTPYINPEEKACILCNRCMEACPTAALQVLPREEVDMGIAQIDRSACYPWVDQGICGACVSVCPLGEKAIGFNLWNQYRPVVRDACVGCGQCVEVCPHPSLPIAVVPRAEGSVARHRI